MTTFHSGEIEVQERAGVRDMAQRVGRSIGQEIPPAAQEFLRAQPFVILGGADENGRVWASLLSGEAGFARALNEHTLRIGALPNEGDPLREMRDGSSAGLLAIEPATRRRMRLNGIVRREGDGLLIHAQQVYANCPKYIQKRSIHQAKGSPLPRAVRSEALSPKQRAQIEEVDTFFIASLAPEGGTDASHRGGNAGFVRVENERRLVFPDYAGNAMFQTLGNLELNPRAGLLFVDFERGTTLQLSGTARVNWDSSALRDFVGAQRLIEFSVEEVVAIESATSWRWELIEPSPFNPA